MHIVTIATAASAALAIALLFWGGALALGNRRVVVTSRLQRWGVGGAVAPEKPKAPKFSLKKGDMTGVGNFIVAQVNRAVARQSFAEKLGRRLARADLKITVGEFLIINVAAVVCGLALGLALLGDPLRTVVCTLVGLILPHWYVRMKQNTRLKKFNNQLGDTIAMLANSLRSGYSMLQSMDLVSREMPPPISDEFQRVTREVGLGLTAEEALGNLVRRINSMDLELMVTAINVQREVGGNLSEILDIIATTIRERVKLQGEIKTLTAQQTMAGYIITGLPIVLFLFLLSIDNEYMSRFWTWVPCGWIMSGVSIVMMGVGYFIMRKITDAATRSTDRGSPRVRRHPRVRGRPHAARVRQTGWHQRPAGRTQRGPQAPGPCPGGARAGPAVRGPRHQARSGPHVAHPDAPGAGSERGHAAEQAQHGGQPAQYDRRGLPWPQNGAGRALRGRGVPDAGSTPGADLSAGASHDPGLDGRGRCGRLLPAGTLDQG